MKNILFLSGILFFLLFSINRADAFVNTALNTLNIAKATQQAILEEAKANKNTIGPKVNGVTLTPEQYVDYKDIEVRIPQLEKLAAEEKAKELGTNATPAITKTYNDLVQELMDTQVSIINGDDSIGQKEHEQDILKRMQNIEKYYSKDANPIEALQGDEDLILSQSRATIKYQSVFKDGPGSSFVYNSLAIIYSNGMKFLKQVVYTDMVNIIKLPFSIGVTLSIIFLVYQLAMGANIDPFFWLRKMALIVFIYSMLFITDDHGTKLFVSWFIDPLIETFFNFASWILSQSTFNINDSVASNVKYPMFAGALILEDNYYRSLGIAKTIFDTQSGTLSFSAALKAGWMAVVFLSAMSVILAIYTRTYAYSIFALIVYFTLTPIMFVFYCFETTKHTSIAWLRGVFTCLATPVVSSIAIGFTLNMIINQFTNFEAATAAGGPMPLTAYVQLTGTTWIAYLVIARVDDITAHLTGGISPNLQSMVLQTITAVSTLKTAAFGAGGMGVNMLTQVGAGDKANMAVHKALDFIEKIPNLLKGK